MFSADRYSKMSLRLNLLRFPAPRRDRKSSQRRRVPLDSVQVTPNRCDVFFPEIERPRGVVASRENPLKVRIGGRLQFG